MKIALKRIWMSAMYLYSFGIDGSTGNSFRFASVSIGDHLPASGAADAQQKTCSDRAERMTCSSNIGAAARKTPFWLPLLYLGQAICNNDLLPLFHLFQACPTVPDFF